VIVEPGTAVMPYLPLEERAKDAGDGAVRPPPREDFAAPVAAPAGEGAK